MNFKKNVLILSVLLMTSGAFASELATSNNGEIQSQEQIRECSSYRDFKLEPASKECVVRNDDGSVRGIIKNVKIELADGSKAKGALISGTNIIFEYPVGEGYFANSVNEASKFCERRGLRLPTGYPKELNGSHGFPNQDSDLQIGMQSGFFTVLSNKDNLDLPSSTRLSRSLLKAMYPNNPDAVALTERDGGAVYTYYSFYSDLSTTIASWPVYFTCVKTQ